jgi:hypothetical protein
LLAADIGWTLKLWLPNLHPIPMAAVVLGSYGLAYFATTYTLEIPEARSVIGRILRFVKVEK